MRPPPGMRVWRDTVGVDVRLAWWTSLLDTTFVVGWVALAASLAGLGTLILTGFLLSTDANVGQRVTASVSLAVIVILLGLLFRYVAQQLQPRQWRINAASVSQVAGPILGSDVTPMPLGLMRLRQAVPPVYEKPLRVAAARPMRAATAADRRRFVGRVGGVETIRLPATLNDQGGAIGYGLLGGLAVVIAALKFDLPIEAAAPAGAAAVLVLCHLVRRRGGTLAVTPRRLVARQGRRRVSLPLARLRALRATGRELRAYHHDGPSVVLLCLARRGDFATIAAHLNDLLGVRRADGPTGHGFEVVTPAEDVPVAAVAEER